MAITRYRSLMPTRTLRHEFDRLFRDMMPFIEEGEEITSAVWAPRMDLSENDQSYLLKADLPGLDKKDIVVNIENHTLTISGERKEETKEEKENYLRMERSYGSFFRSVALPKAVKGNDVEAAFENGVLTIRIPKAEESKPRKVTIT